MDAVQSPMKKSRRKLECLMTVEEAAAYLRFSEGTVRGRCRAKDMPHLKVFSRLRFRRAELDAWLDERAAVALDPEARPQSDG